MQEELRMPSAPGAAGRRRGVGGQACGPGGPSAQGSFGGTDDGEHGRPLLILTKQTQKSAAAPSRTSRSKNEAAPMATVRQEQQDSAPQTWRRLELAVPGTERRRGGLPTLPRPGEGAAEPTGPEASAPQWGKARTTAGGRRVGGLTATAGPDEERRP